MFKFLQQGRSVRTKLLGFVLITVFIIVLVHSGLQLLFLRQLSANEERQELRALYSSFQEEIKRDQESAEALAISIADRPDIQAAFIREDRRTLMTLLNPMFQNLRAKYGITQLYLHRPSGFVFLRIHDPSRYDDNFLNSRPMIASALQSLVTVSGVELDPNGLGVRAIAPMFGTSGLLGLVEVGKDYDQQVIDSMKHRHGAEYKLWVSYQAAAPTGLWPTGSEPTSPSGDLFYYSATYTETLPITGNYYERTLNEGTVHVDYAMREEQPFAVLLGAIYSYGNQRIGVVEIARSRQETLSAIENSQFTNALVTISLIIIGLGLLAVLINMLVLRPLRRLTLVADRQFQGDLSARVENLPRDEFGQLGRTFNSLSQKLNETLNSQTTTINELRATKDVLERTVRQLREASRFKDEFLAVMSHELRTPLNAMIGLLGITLMSSKLDDRTSLMITRARANSERLLSLINNILDISRMEAGRLEITPSEVAVGPLVEKLRADMSILAEQKKLEFVVNVDETLPSKLYIDEDALNKIMMNLVANAFKFTNEGGVTLDLQRQDDKLVITVKDTGIGIPVHMREIIFESFRQVDSSSTRAYGGTGLGLAIVKNLCMAMQGTVKVESEQGKGSRFTVVLPLRLTEREKIPQLEATYAV